MITPNKLDNLRNKMANGKETIGTWMQIPSSSIAEILGKSGYDWVALDLEHGHFSTEQLPDMFRAIELGGALPFARIAECTKENIKTTLDAGAKGLILPMIESSQQLKIAIDNAFYPPKGCRGVGFSRANLFGNQLYEYIENDANSIFIVALIEHINAVTHLDNILSVESLDAIMIGPYDLSASMNMTGDFQNKKFISAMESILTNAKKNNIHVGIHVVTPDEKELKNKIREGYRFIAYGVDAIFLMEKSRNPLL